MAIGASKSSQSLLADYACPLNELAADRAVTRVVVGADLLQKYQAGLGAMVVTVSSGAAHKLPMPWSPLWGCVISHSDVRFAAGVKPLLDGKPRDISMPSKLLAPLG